MGIFDIFKRQQVAVQPQVEERKVNLNGLGFNSFSSYNREQSLKLSAVYCATQQISNAVAVLPIDIYEKSEKEKMKINHPLWGVLNLKPDMKNTHFNFFKQLIESVILRGNGYAFIERDSRLNIKRLIYLDTADVTPLKQVDGTVKYIINGIQGAVDASSIIDLHMHVDETFRGISLIKYASQTLATSTEAEKQAENFFKGGCNLSGIIKVNAPLSTDQKKELVNNWKGTFNNASSNVPVVVLPQNVDYQPISVSSEDAQLLESRQFSILEIARFFQIPPAKLMVMDNESYNSMEMSQLTYMSDTILPYVQMIIDEFNTKLFRPSEIGKYIVDFDFAKLLSTNKKTEADYYSALIKNGIMTLNEARVKLGLERVEGEEGDILYMQISYGTAKDIAAGAYIKQTAQSQNQKVDNKVSNNKEETTEE